jgi:hypothetical protein
MTQTILFFFYSQQLLWTVHRSVIKNPARPGGKRNHEIGACSLGRCRRNPAENERSIDCFILKSYFLSHAGVSENGQLRAFCTPVTGWRICWGWTRAKLNREIKWAR